MALVLPSLDGGGAERIASALAKYWVRAGHEVTVVTVWSREVDVYALPPAVGRVALNRGGESRHLLEGLVHAAGRALALRRALLGLHPDTVVSFLVSANVLSLVATLGTGVPVFACERSDPRHERIGAPWVALRRLLYPRAAGVVVQTESVGAWARRFCSRVHVIPNFVERPPQVAMPGIDHGTRRLIAVGRLGREKGFDLLIQAFARVATSHPEWVLTILGEGSQRRNLEALVAELHLEQRVVMPGRVADPLPHLAAAHAFALPSRYEGFPNAMLEAMACGLPVVAFDCPSGPGEIVTHERNGLLVQAGDVPQLAAALDRIMGNPSERVRMGHDAREIAAVLAPERILERWSALFQGVEP